MKTIIALLVAVCFVVTPWIADAGKGGTKGPGDKAYEKADDNAKFKRQEEVDETDEPPKKKKRKRGQAMEGEDQGKGEMNKEKKKESKEKGGAD